MSADVVLAFDTATSSTAVALTGGAVHEPAELRDDPAEGQRPRHAQALLTLARRLLTAQQLSFADVDRIVVGTGPGGFTGLRIGLATARALALGSGAEIVGISTLRTLDRPARSAAQEGQVVAAILDARRGEVFVQACRDGEEVVAPIAVTPPEFAGLAAQHGASPAAPWLGVGDGAIRFRAILEPAGIAIPADDSPLHRVSATVLAELGTQAEAVPRVEVLPDYLRLPDAEITRRARSDP
jgi:tRNA threonylcarbamoyladenosine biosynthesis protein TsaB